MKKMTIIMLFAAIAVFAAGCAGNPEIEKPDAPETEVEAPAEDVEAKAVKTGMILGEYSFEEDGIYSSGRKVGRFEDGRSMLSLAEFANHFGWQISVTENDWELSKDGYSARGIRGSEECQALFEGATVGRFGISQPAVFGEGDVWLYSVDMERIFGLDALWLPDEKTLYLKQESYDISGFAAEGVLRASGERAVASYRYIFKGDEGDVFVDSALPSIELMREGEPFCRHSSAQLAEYSEGEELEYKLEALSRQISIFDEVDMTAVLSKGERILAAFDTRFSIESPEDEPIEITQFGPWDIFGLDEPDRLLTVCEGEEMGVSGYCLAEGLKAIIEKRRDKDEFEVVAEIDVETEDERFDEVLEMQEGFHRISMMVLRDGKYQKGARFYVEFIK